MGLLYEFIIYGTKYPPYFIYNIPKDMYVYLYLYVLGIIFKSLKNKHELCDILINNNSFEQKKEIISAHESRSNRPLKLEMKISSL